MWYSLVSACRLSVVECRQRIVRCRCHWLLFVHGHRMLLFRCWLLLVSVANFSHLALPTSDSKRGYTCPVGAENNSQEGLDPKGLNESIPLPTHWQLFTYFIGSRAQTLLKVILLTIQENCFRRGWRGGGLGFLWILLSFHKLNAWFETRGYYYHEAVGGWGEGGGWLHNWVLEKHQYDFFFLKDSTFISTVL